MVFHELINNITLLVTVILFFSLIYEHFYNHETSRHIFFGFVFGFAALIGMQNSFVLAEGVVFDIRSVILSIASLFGGPIAALISTAIAASVRWYMGGVGVMMGVITVVSSSLYGLLVYWWLKRHDKTPGWIFLYLFGLIVNATVLVWTVFLPEAIRKQVFEGIALPILLLYPVATVFFGMIIINVKKNINNKLASRMNEKRFNLAMEASSDGMWEYEPQSRKAYYSPTWKKMLGYGPEEIEDSYGAWESRLHEEDRERAVGALAAYEKNPVGIYESMYRMKHKDGSDVYILSKGGAVTDSEGHVESFIGTHTDITTVKKVEEQLKELNETLEEKVAEEVEKNRQKDLLLVQQAKLASLGEMLVAISHHWRQPLTVVSLLLQDIMDLYDSGELTREYLHESVDKSLEAINKMSTTIDDFRLFFEPGNKQETFSLQESIEDVCRIVEGEFHNAGIVFERDFSEENIRLFGFKNHFKQVVLNILSNSRDAIAACGVEKGAGRVKLAVSREGGQIHMEIADNGGGVSEQALQEIFNPYFTTKEQGSGEGIGLYMAKIIIEKYFKGTIRAHNDGDGLVMVIDIPDVLEPQSA